VAKEARRRERLSTHLTWNQIILYIKRNRYKKMRGRDERWQRCDIDLSREEGITWWLIVGRNSCGFIVDSAVIWDVRFEHGFSPIDQLDS
jgi:hypothetical protein